MLTAVYNCLFPFFYSESQVPYLFQAFMAFNTLSISSLQVKICVSTKIWKEYMENIFKNLLRFKKCVQKMVHLVCKWNINFVRTNQVFFKNLSNMSDSILLWKFASILHILCLDTYFFCWLVTWMKTLSIIN